MWRVAAGWMAILVLLACSIWMLLLLGVMEPPQEEQAVQAVVIEDVYGPSVRQDIYSSSGMIEPLPSPSRPRMEPYRPGQQLLTQP